MEKAIMKFQKLSMVILILVLCSLTAHAQTTAFSYQGRLSEAGNPVTGTRFFRFTLFDENGAAIPGATLDQTLTVTNGIFNTSLDFGAIAFPGANRSLKISVKTNAGDAYTDLSPRQEILAAPYSIKSKTADTATNADQLGGVDSTLFVQKDAGGNVSITGGLTVAGSLSLDIVNAQTQYNLGGQRILSAPGLNTFAGINSGNANTTGSFNTFFGLGSGSANTTGGGNSFFGSSAGERNLTGNQNTFVGNAAGFSNTTAGNNSFFGFLAGYKNTAANNSFFGAGAGQETTTGYDNAFFGQGAGQANITGYENSFFGKSSGLRNTTGIQNSFFGLNAGINNTTGNDNVFIGAAAGTLNQSGSDNTFVGYFAGLKNTVSSNSFFGAGSGQENTTGANNSFFSYVAGLSNQTGGGNSFFGFNAGCVFLPAARSEK